MASAATVCVHLARSGNSIDTADQNDDATSTAEANDLGEIETKARHS